jgi:hypothetical protein
MHMLLAFKMEGTGSLAGTQVGGATTVNAAWGALRSDVFDTARRLRAGKTETRLVGLGVRVTIGRASVAVASRDDLARSASRGRAGAARARREISFGRAGPD